MARDIVFRLEEERFFDQISEDEGPPLVVIGIFSTLAAAQAYPRAAGCEEWVEATGSTDEYRWWSSYGADDRNYYITEDVID